VKYFAHRGASALAPENTAESFALAIKLGMTMFELDAHLTKDGVLAVHHDFNLQRTAGVPLVIKDTDYAVLKQANVAAHFGAGKTAVMPTLAEVLHILKGQEIINIEVKNEGGVYKGIEPLIIKEVEKAGVKDSVLYSSFDHETLARLRALDAACRIGVLMGEVPPDTAIATAKKLDAVSLNLSKRTVTSDIVNKAHAAGLIVLIYTVNDRQTLQALAAIGVDGVFTNDPNIR